MINRIFIIYTDALPSSIYCKFCLTSFSSIYAFLSPTTLSFLDCLIVYNDKRQLTNFKSSQTSLCYMPMTVEFSTVRSNSKTVRYINRYARLWHFNWQNCRQYRNYRGVKNEGNFQQKSCKQAIKSPPSHFE